MVEGLDRLKRRFDAIPQAVRDAAKAELERAAQEVVDTMRRFAPVESGDLRDSINWTWGDAPAGTMTIGTVGGTEYGALRITIYAGGKDAFYARFQEFGTVKMPAHPFFYPAWRSKKRKLRGRLSRAISKAIKATA